jgi:VanZ family protein
VKKFFKLWVPVFLWAGLIFYLSNISSLKTDWGVWDFILRKIAHVLEYFILTALLFRAFKGSFILSANQIIFLPVILSFFYALTDEFHQTFITTRSGNIFDVMIDSLGMVAFYLFYLKFRKDE